MKTKDIGKLDVVNMIDLMTESLDNQFTPRQTGNTPITPVIILYMGEKAGEASRAITYAIKKNWRTKAVSNIPQLLFRKCTDDSSNSISRIKPDEGIEEELDEYGFEDMVDEVQSYDTCFSVMNQLLLCTVESIDDCESINDFQEISEAITSLRKEAGIEEYRMIRFVLLNESARKKKLSGEVRSFLADSWKKHTINESLVIISNRLRDNSLLMGERLIANYQLVGSLIVISNSLTKEFQNGISLFLRNNLSYAVTASYSRLDRPNRKITEIVLQSILKWISKHISESIKLSLNDIYKKMGISGGKMLFVEQFFNNSVKTHLPSSDLFEYFPRRTGNFGSLLQMSFKAFDEETFGGFNLFIDRLSVFDIPMLDAFRRDFREYLEESITEPEAAASLTDTNIKNIISELTIDKPRESLQLKQYIEDSMKYAFLEKILPVCAEELKSYYEESRNHVFLLEKFTEELNNHSSVQPGDLQLQKFYEEIVTNFLNGEQGIELLNQYSKCDGKTSEFCELLRKTFETLISSNRIFSLPLEDELAERMQGDRNSMKIVDQELMDNITGRTRLQTIGPINEYYHIVMGNMYNEEGHVTTIANHLKAALNPTNTFQYLDTGDRNHFEAIVLYAVELGNMYFS